jgi:hypothetical protein
MIERKMHLALDYDDTYTLDPEFWDDFIALARRKGHRVYCVTCRVETPETAEIIDIPVPVYYTSMGAKKAHMEARGIHIDVWIDDYPQCVENGR